MRKTRLLEIDPGRYDPEAARPALEIVRRAGLVIYPTETFYALGADAFSADAVRKIFALKERDRGKPLSVVVADTASAERLAAAVPRGFQELAAAFWPGPLTLVLEAQSVFPREILGPGGTIALRVPGLAWLRRFLADLRIPLTATSANVSGGGDIADPDEIVRTFRGRVEAIVNGGKTPGGRASTIVDLTVRPFRILREGAVARSELSAFLS
jgi:L-threonylcarbamoyladenylate synthase